MAAPASPLLHILLRAAAARDLFGWASRLPRNRRDARRGGRGNRTVAVLWDTDSSRMADDGRQERTRTDGTMRQHTADTGSTSSHAPARLGPAYPHT